MEPLSGYKVTVSILLELTTEVTVPAENAEQAEEQIQEWLDQRSDKALSIFQTTELVDDAVDFKIVDVFESKTVVGAQALEEDTWQDESLSGERPTTLPSPIEDKSIARVLRLIKNVPPSNC
jgi:hypothetical protein